ncbi:MAG TPA: hypothetical protein VFU27_08105, partial [Terriglobales bacterium]|nr:hypothetical protein [Terriglobales bacterium]
MESIRKWVTGLLFLPVLILPAWGAHKKRRSAPARPLATLRNSGLEVRVAPDGSYSIFTHGASAATLHAQVAAIIDFRMLPSSAYPKHTVAQTTFLDDLGPGHTLTITHSGLSGEPDLICSVKLYDHHPYGSVAVSVRNSTQNRITVQQIRAIQATGEPIIGLNGPPEQDRVMSDSYSEDRPEMKIMDLT